MLKQVENVYDSTFIFCNKTREKIWDKPVHAENHFGDDEQEIEEFSEICLLLSTCENILEI